MGLDREVIASGLARLDEYLRILEELALVDEGAFVADPRTHGSAERFLHLAIECVFDVGTHCIAAFGLKRPEQYSDILPTLAEASIISRRTDTELESLAGFRNRLVHDYFRLDRRRVHLFMRTRLDGFRLFAQDVARWLDSSSES